MYIPIGPSKKDLYKIVIGLLLIIYLLFLRMYKPKADTLSIDSDMGVIYSDNASIINQPNVSTTWNWGYNYSNLSRIDGIEIYLHSGSGDFVTSNNYLTFMLGGTSITNQPNALASNPFSIGGAVLKVQGASYMCSVDSNNASVVNEDTTGGTSTGVESVTSWSATINCDVSNGVNIGTSDNFASLWIQGNSIGVFNYTGFKIYIHKNAYYSSSKIFGNTQAIQNIQNDTNNISNSINDSSIDNSSANNFTNNSAFQDSKGLDAIIKAPLNFIQSLTSSTCSSISLTIPFIDANVSLPCMSTIYNKALGQQLVNLIALVINGVVLYRYCLKILQIVKDAKNPNKDGLEVLDL